MESERFNKTEADELTQAISDGLGRRQQKLDRMAGWEKPTRNVTMRRVFAAMAVAACIGAVFVFSPFWRTPSSPLDDLGIGKPDMTEYRAASAEMTRIESLINEERYEEALRRTAKALKNSDLALYELEFIPEMYESLEEAIYEDSLERISNNELRWTYIYLLVKTENYKEARKQLKTYLKYPAFCVHEEEARELQKKIKKM